MNITRLGCRPATVGGGFNMGGMMSMMWAIDATNAEADRAMDIQELISAARWGDIAAMQSLTGMLGGSIVQTRTGDAAGAFVASMQAGGPMVYNKWIGNYVNAKEVVNCHCNQNAEYVAAAQAAINASSQGGDPYDGHSFSVDGSLAFGGGTNFSFGWVWNKTGDWNFFVSGGPSVGLDALVSFNVKSITQRDKSIPFDPSQYTGWSSSHNISVLALLH